VVNTLAKSFYTLHDIALLNKLKSAFNFSLNLRSWSYRLQNLKKIITNELNNNCNYLTINEVSDVDKLNAYGVLIGFNTLLAILIARSNGLTNELMHVEVKKPINKISAEFTYYTVKVLLQVYSLLP
jgi:hypothetical protein